jgi:hypothetical protein
VDEKGVTVSDQNASAAQIQTLSDALNAALASAGLHISLTRSATTADVGFWEGSGAGLEVTATLNPAGTGLPSPVSGVPATHVDFSIGKVSASIYATPAASDSSGGSNGSGGSGGSCFFCGGYGGFGGFGGFGGSYGGDSGSTPTPTSHTSHSGGSFLLPIGLSGSALLALVFVVQGVSTAAVAATAGYTDARARSALAATEEESK